MVLLLLFQSGQTGFQLIEAGLECELLGGFEAHLQHGAGSGEAHGRGDLRKCHSSQFSFLNSQF